MTCALGNSFHGGSTLEGENERTVAYVMDSDASDSVAVEDFVELAGDDPRSLDCPCP